MTHGEVSTLELKCLKVSLYFLHEFVPVFVHVELFDQRVKVRELLPLLLYAFLKTYYPLVSHMIRDHSARDNKAAPHLAATTPDFVCTGLCKFYGRCEN